MASCADTLECRTHSSPMTRWWTPAKTTLATLLCSRPPARSSARPSHSLIGHRSRGAPTADRAFKSDASGHSFHLAVNLSPLPFNTPHGALCATASSMLQLLVQAPGRLAEAVSHDHNHFPRLAESLLQTLRVYGLHILLLCFPTHSLPPVQPALLPFGHRTYLHNPPSSPYNRPYNAPMCPHIVSSCDTVARSSKPRRTLSTR